MTITSITPAGTAALGETLSTSARAKAATTTDTAISTTLTGYLPTAPQDDLTYSLPTRLYTWAGDASDTISRTMYRDINDSSWYGLKPSFKGLGSALLGRFATTQADFSQSVTRSVRADAQPSPFGGSKIELAITTASGKTVTLSIDFAGHSTSMDGSLSVAVSTQGTLTQDESRAIASLADGFETALEGIAQNSDTSLHPDITPVDLSGLLAYDSSAIGSIDLNVRESAQFGLTALSFHADSKQRSVSMQTQYGSTGLKVDLSNTAIIGPQAQQEAAISHYLAQFDAASTRARSEAQLLEQFKGLFTQLQSNLPDTQGQATDNPPGSPNINSREYLSGLADFQATMRGEFANGLLGPYTTRAGSLDYQSSQHTETVSRNGSSQITQTVSSQLLAKFIQSRNGAMLDVDTGNYDIYTIRDTNTAVTTLTQQDDAVKAATTTQLIDQLEQYRKLVDHHVVQSRDTPRHTVSSRNLLDAG